MHGKIPQRHLECAEVFGFKEMLYFKLACDLAPPVFLSLFVCNIVITETNSLRSDSKMNEAKRAGYFIGSV